ncbi:thioredoxin domain-containing protein [Sorangium sp. So ce448]|uniref:thioredoxin family protein n=1 Tax=Sorangium sp. So ce448 TaxID=3133314 RepID=UPI003F6306C6
MKAAVFGLLLLSVAGCTSAGARSRHGQRDPVAVGEMQLEEELHRVDLLEGEIYAHSPSVAPGNPYDRCADDDREVISRMLAFELMMGKQTKKAADQEYYIRLQTGTPEELLPAIYLRRYYFEGLLECVLGLTGAEPRKAREAHHVSMLTQSNFDAETSRGLVLVDFMTHWCGPCKIMSPELEKLARHHRGEIRVGRLTADRYRELMERFDITSFPMLVLLKDGEEVARLDQYRKYPDLLAWVRGAMSGQSSPSSAHEPQAGQTSASDVR